MNIIETVVAELKQTTERAETAVEAFLWLQQMCVVGVELFQALHSTPHELVSPRARKALSAVEEHLKKRPC